MPFTAPVATTTALYLPVSSDNKNGLKGYNHDRQSQLSYHTKHTGKDIFAPSGVVVGPKVKGQKLSFTSRALVADVVHGISGYVFGFLGYPSFVTRGAYTGTVLMTSPNFGLISGLNPYGNGKVLFVNLPLGYLKSLGTDGMPMHGFLRYFGGNILNMPRHSNHPNGQGGLVLNWHMDSAEALPGMQTLKNAGVWGKGPYSIDFTAGPDTVAFGDGLGLNVPGNLLTQSWIKYFDSLGHNVGSHGGWIHDYYGLNVSETNQAGFEQYLVLNKQAMEAVLLHPINEYSAPEGNNPKWAVTWQEQNGILGYYFGGHTGLSATRSWREGQLMNPGIWAFPVTPFGKYATFEEFQQFGISATDVAAWYKSLVDFNLKNNTSRLVYAHPPGASLPQYLPVLKGLLHYVKQTGATWYTMPVLAQFNKDRLLVTWAETDLTGGVKRFEAIHPVSLAKQTWLLPKTGFYKPKIMSGYGYVNEDINNWLVIAGSGTSLIFTAAPY